MAFYSPIYDGSILNTSDFVNGETPSGTVDGVNKDFTLANTPVAGTLKIYLGTRQQEGSDYTLSGTVISFTYAPPQGSTILCDYEK